MCRKAKKWKERGKATLEKSRGKKSADMSIYSKKEKKNACMITICERGEYRLKMKDEHTQPKGKFLRVRGGACEKEKWKGCVLGEAYGLHFDSF